MHVIHVSAEFAHLAKVGGLADVVYGLAKEQKRQKHDVEVFLPKYQNVNLQQLFALKAFETPFYCKEDGKDVKCIAWRGLLEEVPITLFEIHDERHSFQRESIYGYDDDVLRFILYSTVVFSYLNARESTPDILHLHDWHTALIATLTYSSKKAIAKGVVLTIHNLEYQGKCRSVDLDRFGMTVTDYSMLEHLQDPVRPYLINLLKGGIICSQVVSTVSPTYAKEILTPEQGFGLHTLLQQHQNKLFGILNGIDEQYWSPLSDPFLPAHLMHEKELSDLEHFFNWKRAIRKKICEELNLDFSSKKPLLIAVTRLVEQKGPYLIKHAASQALKLGGQFILLGSSPNKEIQKLFNELKKTYAHSKDLHIHFSYDEALSHHLFAAADMIIIPSLFEPCGLTQMIALRYGTIPIVRKTGGLADTIFDVEDETSPSEKHNGFSFSKLDLEAVSNVLKRAFDYCLYDRNTWNQLIKNGLNMHFNWDKSANQYLELYQLALQNSTSLSKLF